MKNEIFSKNLFQFFSSSFIHSKILYITSCFILSWLYAACSQICINIHIGLVPISLQTFILFLSVFIFGKRSVHAYLFYLVQAICGAPFFTNGGSSFIHLIGPTGGYLVGFFFSMLFLLWLREIKPSLSSLTFLKIIGATMIFYIFGLAQLSFFVGTKNIFYFGLLPFIIGDLLKILCVTFLVRLKTMSCTTEKRRT